MSRYLIFGLLTFLGIFKVQAQVKYIGLSRESLEVLVDLATTMNNDQELQRLDAYIGFLNDLDTLNQVFSENLETPSTSPKLKAELRARIKALDELNYWGRKYREYRQAGNEVEAELSLGQYYISLEKLELKDYFLALNENPAPTVTQSNSTNTNTSYQAGSKLSYYIGMGFNYSLVSYSNVALEPALSGPGESINDKSIGGVSRDFYMGASYQINQDFSGFLELGWSGQNLNNETTATFSDPIFPDGEASFIIRRNIQHRFTDLKFGAAYSMDKLHLRLGLQLSFLNSFDLNFEQVEPFEGGTNSQEFDPEQEYGFTKTRSFLIIGADYPVYNFSFGDQVFFVDAYFQGSLGLSSVLDEEAETTINLFNDTETFTNSLLHLGLRLRL